jgi:hypothetical protein
MSFKLIWYRVLALVIGIIFYVIFIESYRLLIVSKFHYYGFKFWTLPEWWRLLSLGFAIAPLLWLPLSLRRPSDLTAWPLYLFLIFPSSILLPFLSTSPTIEVAQFQFSLVACFGLFEIIRQNGIFRIVGRVSLTPQNFELLLIFLTIVLLLEVFYLGNFNLHFSLDDTYARRFLSRDILPAGSIFSYSVAVLTYVFIPVMLGIGLERRNIMYIALGELSTLAIFSLTGEKAPVFYLPILAFGMFLVYRKGATFGFWFMLAIISLVGFAMLEPLLLGSESVSEFITRRGMAVPALLTNNYREFFSQNPYMMLKDSVIGDFLPWGTTYNIPRARLIGYEYFTNIDVGANVNIWASGFADFGYPGMAAASVIAGLIVKLMDSLAHKNNYFLCCVCCLTTGLVWVNGSLHTSLMSGGVLGLIVLLWIYPPGILRSFWPAWRTRKTIVSRSMGHGVG